MFGCSVLMVSSELDFVNRTRRLSLMPGLWVNSGTYCRGATIPASAAAAPVRAPAREPEGVLPIEACRPLRGTGNL
jgi:hypothetical protein